VRRAAFRRLWAAQSISGVGDQVTLLALPLVAVLRLGATPAQMGLLTAAGWLPHLLLSLVAGAWIDQRRERKRILVWADLGRAVVLATVPLAWALGVLSLGQLYAVAFTVGCLTVFFDQSYGSIVMAIVEPSEVAMAQSRFSTSRAASQVAGPGLAGWLVELVGGAGAIVLDALSFVASAVLLRGIRVTELPVEPETEPWRTRVRAGLRFVLGQPLLRTTAIACGLLNFFDLMLMAVLVLFMARVLALPPALIGTVLAGGAVGGLVGAVVAARVARRIGLGLTIALGGFGIGVAPFSVVLAGGSRPVVVAVLVFGQFVTGVAVMLFDVNQNAVISLVTPHRLRGRSSGALRLLAYGPRPLGALAGGALGTWIGLRPTLWVAAVGGMTGAFVTWWSPMRRLTELPEPAL
jgi:MFS family permease